jgi:hypothetical protein
MVEKDRNIKILFFNLLNDIISGDLIFLLGSYLKNFQDFEFFYDFLHHYKEKKFIRIS